MSGLTVAPVCEWYEEVPASDLREAAVRYAARGQRLMAMFGRHEGDRIELLVAFDAAPDIVTLSTHVPVREPHYPSLAAVIPAAAWYERELAETLGVEPVGHPDLRPLLVARALPKGQFPLRKDFSSGPEATSILERENVSVSGSGVFTIPYGPVRSGVFESDQFIVGTAGEDVLHVDMHMGYVHRGVEKLFESRSPLQAVLLAEQVSGTGTAAHSTAFCSAVERALHLTIPPAARWMRVLIGEMERLYNHFDVIAHLCDDASLGVGQAQFAILKERILRLNAVVSGSRFLRGVNVVGGVRRAPSQEHVHALRAEIEDVRAQSADRLRLLVGTNSFIDRLITTAPVSPELADAFAALGPVARASGVKRDARRDRPYAAYGEADWRVALNTCGDAMARLRVRIAEIDVSFALVEQALAAMPDGPWEAPIPPVPEERAGAYGWAESPRGEVLYWVLLRPDGRVERCKVRSPSFVNWPIFTRAVAGNVLTDFAFAEHSFGLTQAGADL